MNTSHDDEPIPMSALGADGPDDVTPPKTGPWSYLACPGVSRRPGDLASDPEQDDGRG